PTYRPESTPRALCRGLSVRLGSGLPRSTRRADRPAGRASHPWLWLPGLAGRVPSQQDVGRDPLRAGLEECPVSVAITLELAAQLVLEGDGDGRATRFVRRAGARAEHETGRLHER